MVVTDTHTHLYAGEFDNDREEVIRKARDLGINRFFLPNIDSASIPALFRLSDQYPGVCFPMMGLHPCSVNERYNDELKVVEYWLARRKFYAIGEIGIDLYWDKTFIDQQVDAFARQVDLAIKMKLPVVIHTRESFDVAFETISKMNCAGLKGIFHCFSGTLEQAEKVIALGGFKLGIGGVLTFKNAGVDKVVREIPLRHLVLETDAPYLAPVPFRGKRNDPEYLIEVLRFLAALKNLTVEEVAEVTTRNSVEVFSV